MEINLNLINDEGVEYSDHIVQLPCNNLGATLLYRISGVIGSTKSSAFTLMNEENYINVLRINHTELRKNEDSTGKIQVKIQGYFQNGINQEMTVNVIYAQCYYDHCTKCSMSEDQVTHMSAGICT